MKKIIVFAVFIFVTLVSCRKGRTCTCTEYYNGVAQGTPVLTTYEKSTRSQARRACYSYSEVDNVGGTITMDCTFK